MDWKEFSVEPDEGMFEKIQHRLRVRRAWRVTGVATVAVAVIGVAVALLLPKNDSNMEANLQQPTVEQISHTYGNQPADINTTQSEKVANVQTDAHVGSRTVSPADNIAELIPSSSQHVAEPVVALETSSLPMDQQLHSAVRELPSLTTHSSAPQQPNHSVTQTADDPGQQPLVQTQNKSGEPQPEPYHEDNVLWVPNVIIPNGDKAENRTFSIIATSPITEFNIHIYNRGGRLLYTSNDPNFKWDALHNGTPVPQGAYVYVATFRDTDGNPRRQAGTVTVIR